MAMAYLPGYFVQDLEYQGQHLVEPPFWEGWKGFQMRLQDRQGRKVVIEMGPSDVPLNVSDIHSFQHQEQEVAR